MKMAIKFSLEDKDEKTQRSLYESLWRRCVYVEKFPVGDKIKKGRKTLSEAIEVYEDDDDCVVAHVKDKSLTMEGRLVSGVIIGPKEKDMVGLLELGEYLINEEDF
jgi:hypothetical protein